MDLGLFRPRAIPPAPGLASEVARATPKTFSLRLKRSPNLEAPLPGPLPLSGRSDVTPHPRQTACPAPRRRRAP
jgi:hypothetical protein